MKFSNALWQKTEPLFQKILKHPFNVELAKGTLDSERFMFYMEQDAYYLMGFSRALAFIAARAESSKMIHSFLTFAQGALIAERQLHAQFLNSNSWEKVDPSPACLAYVSYLIATAATASLEEAIAATLPCFWIYSEVGNQIALLNSQNHPYKAWIDTYSSQEFSDGTDQAISILDELASQCSTHSLLRMEKAFENSALYEWYFWEDAYNKSLFQIMELTAKPLIPRLQPSDSPFL